MATITKYVNSSQQGNERHTGDDPTNEPWLTIQHGVDWWRDNRTPGDNENVISEANAFVPGPGSIKIVHN